MKSGIQDLYKLRLLAGIMLVNLQMFGRKRERETYAGVVTDGIFQPPVVEPWDEVIETEWRAPTAVFLAVRRVCDRLG